MADVTWDNSGLPPQRKGLPTWAKVLLGCGVVFALAIGGCVAAGIWGFRKVAELGRAQWPAYVETVKQLQDPAATQALYEANPGLKGHYPDAEAFEARVASWRPRMEAPPAEMPAISSGRAISYIGTAAREGRSAVSGYRMGQEWLVVVWKNDRIEDIEFEKKHR